jgi:beta-glucosidase
VLLKNDANLLPLGEKPLKRIAVIGPNAAVAMISGGGSARLLSSYTVSPLEGITNAAEEIGSEVDYALGAITTKLVPLLDLHLTRDENGKPKALVEFWNEVPSDQFLNLEYTPITKEPTWSTPTKSSDCFLADGIVSIKRKKKSSPLCKEEILTIHLFRIPW